MFILHLFRIRVIQLYRILLEIGLLRSGVVLLLLAFLCLAVNYFTGTFEGNLVIVICGTILIYYIHSRRKDKFFLSKFTTYFPIIFFAEYILLLLPIILFIVLSSYPFMALGLIAILFLIACSLFNIPKVKVNFYLLRFIPSWNFEWISGMRRNYKVILLFYILGLLLSVFSYVSLFIIWILSLIIAEFYNNNEGVEILLGQDKGTCRFLKWKLKTQLYSYIVFILPLFLFYSIWNYEIWYISILFFILNLFCFTFLLGVKYSSYVPNKKGYLNEIIILLVFISNFILPLLPLTIFLYVKYSRNAVRNLNFYLHDFN